MYILEKAGLLGSRGEEDLVGQTRGRYGRIHVKEQGEDEFYIWSGCKMRKYGIGVLLIISIMLILSLIKYPLLSWV